MASIFNDFIQVTSWNSHTKVYINVKEIEAFFALENCTAIRTKGNGVYHICESVDWLVMALLDHDNEER